jgi:hypothetical protein
MRRSGPWTLRSTWFSVKLVAVSGIRSHGRSALVVSALALGGLFGSACSDDGARASAEFCQLGRDAVRWYIDFDDEQAVAALVDHPGLDDDDRPAVRDAVDDARAQIAGGNGWSNDRMTAVINDICDLHLTPVTMVP